MTFIYSYHMLPSLLYMYKLQVIMQLLLLQELIQYIQCSLVHLFTSFFQTINKLNMFLLTFELKNTF